jgi:hypothetical protein
MSWVAALSLETWANIVAALGTATAAGIAAAALVMSARAAKASARAADVGERQLEAQTEPLLIEVVQGSLRELPPLRVGVSEFPVQHVGEVLLSSGPAPKPAVFSIPVENIGAGVGRITGTWLQGDGVTIGGPFDPDSYVYVRPEDRVRATLSAIDEQERNVFGEAARTQEGPLQVKVQYENVAGTRVSWLMLELRRIAKEWRVCSVRHEAAEESPLTGSRSVGSPAGPSNDAAGTARSDGTR